MLLNIHNVFIVPIKIRLIALRGTEERDSIITLVKRYIQGVKAV